MIMPRAALDLDSIYGYIANELAAPIAAHNLMEKIETSFFRLQEMLESCPECQDDILKQKRYRKLVVNNYIALYTIDYVAKIITVMRVVNGRQEYSVFV